MNALVLVPNEASELELGVFVAVLNELQALMLINLIVMILAVLAHLVLTAIAPFNRDTLEAFNHSVEVDSVGSKDSEFTIVDRVELDLSVVLSLAWKLGLRLDSNLFVLLNVIYGDAEVRDTSNHQKVAAISGEHHIQQSDGGISLEAASELFARVSVDVHFGIQTVFSSGNQVLVIVGSGGAVPVSLGPI
jgi:hypothetical protein